MRSPISLLLAPFLLSGCPAPSVGAECEQGTARCADGVVEHCDCENLGGSGPFAMDVCTSRYQWQTYTSSFCDDGEICVSDGDYAGCAAPDALPCDPTTDAPRCDGQTAITCVALEEGPRALGAPDNSGPGRWRSERCDASQTCVISGGRWPRALCEGDRIPDLEPVGEDFSAWVGRVEAIGFAATQPRCRNGGSLPVAREDARPAGSWRACTVTLSRGAQELLVSELLFESPEAAQAAVVVLRGRGEGGDPGEPCADGACKALVTGWAVERRVYWVTARSLAWEPAGCEVLAAWPDAQHGMFRCATP